MSGRHFDGFAIFLIWFATLISFYAFVQELFVFDEKLAGGIPMWLQLLRTFMLALYGGSLIAILAQQNWGLTTLLIATGIRIPTGVGYNYFYSITNEPGFELTTRWIVLNTIWIAVFWLLILFLLLWAIRLRATAVD